MSATTEIVYTNASAEEFPGVLECAVNGDDVLIVHDDGRARRFPLRLVTSYDEIAAGEYVRTVHIKR